jgi:pyruvate/2-oxoglutarate dehydrogenase complex dihydrolipoamide acyltransferase (E2) component
MRNELGTYRVVDLTPGRRAWLNTMDLGGPAHTMVGLLEVDVTVAKRLIAEHRTRTGETLSFTGFLIACLARAVEENKDVQMYRKGRKRLVVFDDVHVGMLIEHAGGTLMGHVIHRANHKGYREIHDEIRRVQDEPPPATRGMPGWFRRIMLLPWPLASVAKRVLRAAVRRDPTIIVGNSGTVFVTSVGMFGGGHSGWGITSIPTSLSLVVGGISEKPAVSDGRIERRELLSLTVQLDHDVVDGAPATRFIRRLVELIEQPEWAITGAEEIVLDPGRRVLEELQ